MNYYTLALKAGLGRGTWVRGSACGSSGPGPRAPFPPGLFCAPSGFSAVESCGLQEFLLACASCLSCTYANNILHPGSPLSGSSPSEAHWVPCTGATWSQRQHRGGPLCHLHPAGGISQRNLSGLRDRSRTELVLLRKGKCDLVSSRGAASLVKTFCLP